MSTSAGVNAWASFAIYGQQHGRFERVTHFCLYFLHSARFRPLPQHDYHLAVSPLLEQPLHRQPIRQLDEALINRIAAGEVIERPASVVKECVENALDAGATIITVEIDDGGRELIRITDNGGGIPAAQLTLAFAQHATSKIRSDEDLFRIATMGFRGEALASIGSVSHARILSRTPEDLAAAEIENRGGVLSEITAAAANVGTVVEVRNLFYNVPARRRFLKSASTEAGHVSDMMLRLALPRPDVAFKLVVGGRATMNLQAVSDPVLRLLEAWPDTFRGRSLTLDQKENSARTRLYGIIGLPELAAVTARHQHLYVNGRAVRDKSVSHALRESFRGLTEPGRHPAAVLLIQLPPQDVDVNVHPTKSEVRFHDSSRIHGLVMGSVRELLLAHDLAPSPIFSSGPGPGQAQSGVPFGGSSHSPPTSDYRQSARQQVADFFRASGNGQTNAGGSSSSGLSVFGGDRLPAPLPVMSEISGPSGSSIPASNTISHFQSSPQSSPTSALQLHNSYLVAETDDGLVIIDQHALHERILFEELMQKVGQAPLESQRLLLPVTIRASSRQVALLDGSSHTGSAGLQPLLHQLGIEAHAIGPDAIAIDAFPSMLEKLDIGDFFTSLLDLADAEDGRLSKEQMLHSVLDMMACKAAVKAGDTLRPEEISALLARKDLVDRSSNCPHGRPTMLRMSLRDLEKQFKRTGF